MGELVTSALALAKAILEFCKELKAAGILDIIMNWISALPF